MHFLSLRCSCYALALVLVLSSCAYIIPEDPNQPRNNEVLGDRHKPQLNVLTPYALPTTSNTNAAVQSAAPPPRTELAAPIVNAPAVDEARRVPAENAAFQMSAAGYPSITSVPPRPVTSGPDSAVERLRDTQSTLEGDRAAANESRDRLAHDAAAEPSMLPAAPTSGVVAPADPVRVAPIAPTVAPVQPAAPQITPYNKPQVNAVQPPPAHVFVPAPTAQVVVPALPPTQQFAPPAPMVVANAAPIAPRVPVVNGIQTRAGDFNPLTTPDTDNFYYAPPQVSATVHPARSSYTNGGFIAPSRYYTRRY